MEQAKKLFNNVYLIVGVCGDGETHKRKGKTVFMESERVESLRHCKWVDEVIEDAPWVITPEFVKKHRVDFVAHDDIPYYSDSSHTDVYAWLKREGKFIATKRTSGISTSDIITRIVRDYDVYVRRNLERGVPAQELNISFFKEKGIRMTKQVSDIRARVQKQLHQQESDLRHNWKSSQEELLAALNKWEGKSQEWIKEFALAFSSRGVWLFDRDGELRSSDNSDAIDTDERQQVEVEEDSPSPLGTIAKLKVTLRNAWSRLTSSTSESNQ